MANVVPRHSEWTFRTTSHKPHKISNYNFEHFLLPTDTHNVKKRRVIKTF